MKLLPFTVASLVATCALLVSCDNFGDDSYKYYGSAAVTVKADSKGPYMQLDDSTTLRAKNLTAYPFSQKEVRALCTISYDEQIHFGQENEVYLNMLDSISTNPLTPWSDTSTLSKDPVELISDMTGVDDGYLTLRFRTYHSMNRKHSMKAYFGTDTANPYEVVISHDAHGDTSDKMVESIVAFRLGSLPPTNGKYVPLTLRWTSSGGEKSVTFKYRSR